jgi:hypothetical protein
MHAQIVSADATPATKNGLLLWLAGLLVRT